MKTKTAGVTAPRQTKPTRYPSGFEAPRKACTNGENSEDLLADLDKVVHLGWQPDELNEFARIYWHAPGKDHATASAYTIAIWFIASGNEIASDFLRLFREGNNVPAPPRVMVRKQRPKLAPQFNMDWPGHTDAFREEVAALARKDKGLPSDAYIGPLGWKIACHKHFELTESDEA